jgi:NADH-quinone oxidoreductase subunit C
MKPSDLQDKLRERFGDQLQQCTVSVGEVTIEVLAPDLIDLCTALRDEQVFRFEQLMDVCGVDYAAYGNVEWETENATSAGFSRGVAVNDVARLSFLEDELSVETSTGERRFAAVYHLLSMMHNHRLRIRVYAPDSQLPVIPSVIEIWNGADWFEREAFDLFGIIFEGHPDLRRILTDYGFIGHPFRKDFPLSGNVEVRYDPEKRRVVYQPVSIEPRVLVPRVIRTESHTENNDEPAAEEGASNA